MYAHAGTYREILEKWTNFRRSCGKEAFLESFIQVFLQKSSYKLLDQAQQSVLHEFSEKQLKESFFCGIS